MKKYGLFLVCVTLSIMTVACGTSTGDKQVGKAPEITISEIRETTDDAKTVVKGSVNDTRIISFVDNTVLENAGGNIDEILNELSSVDIVAVIENVDGGKNITTETQEQR